MLSAILSKSECAECKFCCSFRRQSLWESPVFLEANVIKIKEKFPNVKFRKIVSEVEDGKSKDGKLSGNENESFSAKRKYFTFDISDKYLTNDSKEEVACPFLDSVKGCLLSDDLKPFDCKIWPLRVVKSKKGNKEELGVELKENLKNGENLEIALTPTCPAINKIPFEKVCNFVNSSLRKIILSEAEKNPGIVKEKTEFLSNIIR